MTINPIGIVICRVGAIWMAVTAFSGIGFTITALLASPEETASSVAYYLVSILVPFVSAFILWHYAEDISSTRFGTTGRATADSADSDVLVMIGTYLLGIYILVAGVVNLSETETTTWMISSWNKDNEMIAETMSASTVGGRVSNALQILLGLALLIRGKKGLR